MVPCNVTHSVQQDDSTCLCEDGFTGSIQWKDGQFEGTCSPAPCYIQHTNGKNGTDCACADGFIGNITWNGSVPDGVGGTCFRNIFFLWFSITCICLKKRNDEKWLSSKILKSCLHIFRRYIAHSSPKICGKICIILPSLLRSTYQAVVKVSKLQPSNQHHPFQEQLFHAGRGFVQARAGPTKNPQEQTAGVLSSALQRQKCSSSGQGLYMRRWLFRAH